MLGIWTDRYGGRLVYTATMLAAAVATFLLAFAHTYPQMLIAALGVGLAGGSFAVGVAYVSRFFPAGRQGTALGIFGVGNVGAAVTKFLAPFVLLAWGWQSVALIWAAALAVMAVVFWFTTGDDPVIRERRRPAGGAASSFLAEFAPLKNVQRLALRASIISSPSARFVALALWLPRYLIGVYGFDIATAGMIGAAYSIPASIFRAYGGVLSDRIGARTVLYWTFARLGRRRRSSCRCRRPTMSCAASTGRSPSISRSARSAFIVVAFVLGFFMSLGKAAVYKHIPAYYPDNVGAVGGLVGMIGGLGGFVLPIAFGALNDLTGLWSSCFMLLFVDRRRLLRLDAPRRPPDGAQRRPSPRRPSPSRPNEPERISDHDRETRHHRQRHGRRAGCSSICSKHAPGRYEITIFSAEPRVNYNRIMLSPVLSGEKDFERDRHPRRRLVHQERHHAATRATRSSRSTARPRRSPPTTASIEPYDKLLIATGSAPFIIPVPGNDLPGVLTFRDLDDVDAMLLAAAVARQGRGHRRRPARPRGGGRACSARGMEVTVLHLMPTLMERQLDPAAGYLLQTALEARGIKVITKANTKAILGERQGRGRASSRTAASSRPTSSSWRSASGPNAGLAKDAGLEVNRGIVVDDHMRTSDPAIFAVGECVEHRRPGLRPGRAALRDGAGRGRAARRRRRRRPSSTPTRRPS